jgi:hypothetical protein
MFYQGHSNFQSSLTVGNTIAQFSLPNSQVEERLADGRNTWDSSFGADLNSKIVLSSSRLT